MALISIGSTLQWSDFETVWQWMLVLLHSTVQFCGEYIGSPHGLEKNDFFAQCYLTQFRAAKGYRKAMHMFEFGQLIWTNKITPQPGVGKRFINPIGKYN